MAAVAVMDRQGRPLLLRTYASPDSVLSSPNCPYQAHLLVNGTTDILKIQFLLFSSLDRAQDIVASQELAVKERRLGAGATAPLEVRQLSTYNTVYSDAASAADSNNNNNASSNNNSSSPSKAARDQRFMGKLVQSGRFTSYGFRSASGLHTLLVTVGAEAPRDAMAPLSKSVYDAASSALCNPFLTPHFCWQAQETLFRQRRQEALRAAAGEAAAAPGSASALAACLVLPSGVAEHSWPRVYAPGLAEGTGGATTEEPMASLALSRSFTSHLDKVVLPYSVTTRSFIVRAVKAVA